jgi:flagellin
MSWRAFSGAAKQVETGIRRLSSGLQIASAADNAAGLSISQRIRAQFQGLAQAQRNVLDGISLVQTAEGTLQQVNTLLQRADELAVQAANGVFTEAQKGNIQAEVDQIITEIDRVTGTASFNNIRLFGGDGSLTKAQVIVGLRSGWLSETEKIIHDWYGMDGDLSTLTVALENSGSDSAWATGNRNPSSGKLENLVLHVNIQDFAGVGSPDGGTAPIYNDRKVARALTQAVLGCNVDTNIVDDWFTSGAADFIAGRDELLQSDVATYGVNGVVNAMGDVLTGTWVDDSLHRSAAYVAVKYLNSLLSPFTMQDVMSELRAGNSLNAALMTTLGTDVDGFINGFFLPNGANYLLTAVDLADADVGAIQGGNASTVIPNGAVYTEDPLVNFKVKWPGSAETQDITLQVGANYGDTLILKIPEISSFSLDLLGLDLVNKASDAMSRVQTAIKTVTSVRSDLGAVNNRLEHTVQVNLVASENEQASWSRIVDLDYARGVADLAKQQMLVQASGAMLAQANSTRQHVMWLLRGISEAPLATMVFGA